jgi:hypothetical protein
VNIYIKSLGKILALWDGSDKVDDAELCDMPHSGIAGNSRQGVSEATAETARAPEITGCQDFHQPARPARGTGALEGERPRLADAHGGDSFQNGSPLVK